MSASGYIPRPARCPHCESPYDGEQPDDCCPGREVEVLRRERDEARDTLRYWRDKAERQAARAGRFKAERDTARAERDAEDDELVIVRVDGDALCLMCNKRYRNHPFDEVNVSELDGTPYLRISCIGLRLKL